LQLDIQFKNGKLAFSLLPEMLNMAFKRAHSDEEIDTLALHLQSLRTSGDAIRPWFRKNRDVILELVHSSWSWDAIARALTNAQITYRTGKPWTADWLQADFWRAQAPLKGYAKRNRSQTPVPSGLAATTLPNNSSQINTTASINATASSNVSTGEAGKAQSEKPAPRFKAVSIKPFEPRRPQTEGELAQIEQNRMHAFGRR